MDRVFHVLLSLICSLNVLFSEQIQRLNVYEMSGGLYEK